MGHSVGTNGTINGSTDVAESNLANGQVLLWNGSQGKWYNSASAVSSVIAINAQPSSATTYTVQLSDIGGEIEMWNSGPNTVYIPPYSTTQFPPGANFNIRQMGAGVTSITYSVGSTTVTLNAPNGLSIANQYMTATVICSSQDNWVVDGGVST